MIGFQEKVVRKALLSIFSISVMGLPACSVVDPYRDGDNTAYQESISLASAVEYAESTRERYYYNVQEQTFINKATGVALVGAAAAAAFFGIQGNHATIVTGLGVGGAGLFGVNSLLYSYPRLGVYVAGAKAISCGISLYAPFGTYFRNDFAESVAKLREQMVLVRQLSVETYDPSGVNRVFALSVLKDTESTLKNTAKIDAQLSTAGVQLYETVQIIHANVSQEILKHEPNLEEVIKDLGTNLQADVSNITGQSNVKNTEDGINSRAPSNEDQEIVSARSGSDKETEQSRLAATPSNLARQTQILLNLRHDIESRITEFIELPQATDLKACAEFETIKPFLVLPQPTLTVNLREGSGGVVRVSGGKRPYSYGWVGPAPSDGVKVEDKPFTSERMGMEIVVSGEGAVPDQNLQLVVQDSAEALKTVMVNITGTGETPADRAAPAPAAARAVRVPTVSTTVMRLQGRLIELGCLAPLRPVGSAQVSNLDGLPGPETNRAIGRLQEAVAGAGSGGAAQQTPSAAGPNSGSYQRALALANSTNVRC